MSEYGDRDRLVRLVVRSECIGTTSLHTLTLVGATYESDFHFSLTEHSCFAHPFSLSYFQVHSDRATPQILGLVFKEFVFDFTLY